MARPVRAVAAPVEVGITLHHRSLGHRSGSNDADRLCCPQVEEPKTKAAPIELHGFKLVKEQFVNEYNSHVLMYRHEKTGVSHSHACSAHTTAWQIPLVHSSSAAGEGGALTVVHVTSMIVKEDAKSGKEQGAQERQETALLASSLHVWMLRQVRGLKAGCATACHEASWAHNLQHVLRAGSAPECVRRRGGDVAGEQRREQDVRGGVPDAGGQQQGHPAHPGAQRAVRLAQVPHQGALRRAHEGVPADLPQRLHLPRPHLLPRRLHQPAGAPPHAWF